MNLFNLTTSFAVLYMEASQSHLESNDTGLRQGEAGEVLLALDYMLQLAPHEHASKEPGYLCEMTSN